MGCVKPAIAPARHATASRASVCRALMDISWRVARVASTAPCGRTLQTTARAAAASHTVTSAQMTGTVSVGSSAVCSAQLSDKTHGKQDATRSAVCVIVPECSFLYLMLHGACKASCPSGYYEDMEEGRCGQCHPTCGTCSGPMEDDCESCSSFNPKLYKGVCTKDCPPRTYYDSEAIECQGESPKFVLSQQPTVMIMSGIFSHLSIYSNPSLLSCQRFFPASLVLWVI